MSKAFFYSHRTAIMAILNITPDSFSDGGQLFGEDFNQSVDAVLHAAQSALDAGADVLDIGGESTRPGAAEISLDEELCRVIPMIKALKQVFPHAVLSIDTRKSEVARQAVEAGARIINDVSGLQYDPGMIAVAADTGVSLVIMHTQGTPQTMQHNPAYPRGVLAEVMTFFERQIALATRHGISPNRIILDPGFGFGKTIDHNLQLLAQLNIFQPLGFPLLAGASRKSFLTLGQGEPETDIASKQYHRDLLTAASLTTAIANGANMVRIHNVPALAPVIRLADRLYKPTPVLVS